MGTAILTSITSLVFLFVGYWLGYSNHAGKNPVEVIADQMPEPKPDEPLIIDEEEEYRIERERKGDVDW